MKKKEALVRTAARLFAERGYEGTTTAGIAREAGVTEPLIYYHFTGKEDLFNYILERAAETYSERLETLKADTRTQFEKIAKLIRLHFH
ncbi:MAG: TetR/AcrR family transcriptional regulator, partial [Deltaproteobacteria bacterium]